MKQGCCFQCLDAGHTSRDCKSKQRCNIEGCTKDRHHTLLHKDNASGPADSEKALCTATKNIYSDQDSSGHFFMTLPVKITLCWIVDHNKHFAHDVLLLS